ncbi:MAG: hypothetical protein JWN92_2963, partial [Candidatus Acidoferrum typicum]|nr:hypothetical protein [Candidatus Acidoferrum typicum]
MCSVQQVAETRERVGAGEGHGKHIAAGFGDE